MRILKLRCGRRIQRSISKISIDKQNILYILRVPKKLMYVPHYDAILHAIGTSREKLGSTNEVTVPLSLFKFLLQIALVNSEFNVSGYLACNPDIQEAAKAGKVPDPKMHYLNFGYFEGRRGAAPPVDESWYCRTYPDVAAAVKKGLIASGADHFGTIGAEEFRAPSSACLRDSSEWKKATGKS